MTPPVVSIVGKSNSGKTTLLEKLIPELKGRGYRVGTIKHDAHSFSIDHPGKDSWRHTEAGSEVMVISSASQAAMVRRLDGELSLDAIAGEYMGSVDIVLTEGFKREDKPKVEVLAPGETELICEPDDLLMVASDDAVELGVPVVARDNAVAVADLLEDKFLKGRVAPKVDLVIDGKKIPLNPIMRAMTINTVVGLVSSLKGGRNPGSIELRIDKKSKE